MCRTNTSISTGASDVIRVVDLFSGCGGLSLGFRLFRGRLVYDEILAIDNDPAVIRCFNENISRPSGIIGRTGDVNWFSHPSEILLYYLLHFAQIKHDRVLEAALAELKVGSFLAHIKGIDSQFKRTFQKVTAREAYRKDWSFVDPEATKLAMVRSFMDRLGLASLQRGAINELLWVQEYGEFDEICQEDSQDGIYPVLQGNANRVWETEITKLVDASQKAGHGQHAVVNARIETLLRFLMGPSGSALKECWLQWSSRRDSTKAEFCLKVENSLQRLYEDGRDVRLVIGGPPCKGFSRIARPVMHSLREQGASAWTSHEYGDERNALMNQYILFLRTFKPKIFLFENVSNFISSLKTPKGQLDPATALAEGIDALSDHSVRYKVCSRVIRSADHAVPQERDRYIMIGINAEVMEADAAAKGFFSFPDYEDRVPLAIALQGLGPAHKVNWGGNSLEMKSATKTESPAYTLLDPTYPPSWQRYINWVRNPHEHHSNSATDAHIYRGLRRDDAALLELFGPGQRWMDYEVRNARTLADLRAIVRRVAEVAERRKDPDLPDFSTLKELLGRLDANLALRLLLEETEASLGEQHLLLPHYMKNGTSSHGDWWERLSAVRPSKTIIAHIGKDTYSYMHPHEPRAITMREAARVQSFPDFFSFKTTGIVEGYTMIGNAVPPLLANDFAIRIAELDEKYHIFSLALALARTARHSLRAKTRVALRHSSLNHRATLVAHSEGAKD
jgi:site-specific DNA-cytosine methylase